MRSLRQWLTLLALTAVIAGCASTDDSIDDAEMAEIDQAAATEAETEAADGADASGASASDGVTGEPLDDPDSALSDRVVYFDYDSATLSDEAMTLIEAHGEYLGRNSDRQLLVEGHTDERGAREYNLALGERRAEAVEQALLIAGADANQIEVVSYGEESPAVSGSNESAWAQNRRAALVYER